MLSASADRPRLVRCLARHRRLAGDQPSSDHVQSRAQRARGEPTAAVVDSQSVKATEAGGPRGYDARKKMRVASGMPWWTQTVAPRRRISHDADQTAGSFRASSKSDFQECQNYSTVVEYDAMRSKIVLSSRHRRLPIELLRSTDLMSLRLERRLRIVQVWPRRKAQRTS